MSKRQLDKGSKPASKKSKKVDKSNNNDVKDIFECIEKDNENTLSFILLACGNTIDINSIRNKDGLYPLYFACLHNKKKVMQFLVNYKYIDINKLCNGRSALHIAIQQKHHDIIDILLRQDRTNVNKLNHRQRNALHCACHVGDLIVVNKLLNVTGIRFNDEDKNRMSPLFIACSRGHTDIVKRLLQIKNLILFPLSMLSGVSVVHAACRHGHLDILKLLLKKKKDCINFGDTISGSPIYVASANNQIFIVQYLLRLKDIIINHSNYNPLKIACQYNHIEIVKLLLANPTINVNCGDYSPLQAACERNYIQIVYVLLKHPRIKLNDSTNTPLIWMILQNNNRQEVAIALLTKMNHRDPEQIRTIRNENNESIFDLAIKSNIEQVIKYLLAEKHFSLDYQLFGTSDTPLMFACKSNYYNMAFLFLSKLYPCDVNTVDAHGCTALYYACEQKSSIMIERLINVLQINTMAGDKSPLIIALINRDERKIVLLLKHPSMNVLQEMKKIKHYNQPIDTDMLNLLFNHSQ